MARIGYNWAVTKSGPPPEKQISNNDYPHHRRADIAYTHYISGRIPSEIVEFLRFQGIECTEQDIEYDIQHIQTRLPTRTLIAHENDRNRLLIQRTEGEQYRRLLGEALKVQASTYLAAGVSPTGVLKEYRESVGQQEKPGAMNINVSQNTMNVGGAAASGIGSSEDLLRRVMSRMKADQAALPAVIEVEGTPVDIPPVAEMPELEEDDDRIPDPDD